MPKFRAKAMVVVEVDVEAPGKHDVKRLVSQFLPGVIANSPIVHCGDPLVSTVTKLED